MSFDAWKDLIRQAGVDPSDVDHAWLMQQFRMGTSPAHAAQAISKARQTPAIIMPPIQPTANAAIYKGSPGYGWIVGGGFLCFLIIFSAVAFSARRVARTPPINAATNTAPVPEQDRNVEEKDSTEFTSPNIHSNPAPQRSQTDSGFSERWAAVCKVFEDQGLYVEPWDSNAPWTMRVHIPSTIAIDMTPTQARELAGMARSRIGNEAIVYIKSEGGQTLAKAAPWGIE
ncbi:MAG: hypothetical protein JST12_14745 [Armatimonadetes bacterium]|nr:hypothetical protein [Armatimonadota bacterium]